MAMYESIAKFYDDIFPLKDIRLSFLDSILREKGLTVLDIGCASGELALVLTKKGHHTIGIDLDSQMIKIAEEKAQKQGLNTTFLIKDMTQIGEDFSPGSFDAVLCLGNTLVHLENLEKIREFFFALHKVLKNSGVVVVQVVNYDRLWSEGLDGLPLLESENFLFRREYEYEREEHRLRFLTRLTQKKTGQVIENCETLYPLTFKELDEALMDAGFGDRQFFGNENKAPYDGKSPALIAVARRPGGCSPRRGAWTPGKSFY